MISIQVPSESSSVQRVTINNAIFYIELHWSTRETSWYISILDVSRNYLLSGRKIQFGTSITKKYGISSLSGNLYILKNTDTTSEVSRTNFGQGLDYELVWMSTSEELAFTTG